MAKVTPFIPRADASGWTAAERERLAELAGRLEATFGRVDATYGVSDKGEPWCVITDEDDEVIVHVARINGQVFIHHAGEDVLRVGDTLWSACERLMGEGWRDDREDVVVSLNRRQAQSVLALAVLADFVYEVVDADAATPDDTPAFKAESVATAVLTLALAASAAQAAPEPPQIPTAAIESSQTLAAAPSEDSAPRAAALSDDDHLQPVAHDSGDDPSAAMPEAPPVEPPASAARVQVGGDGNDLLVGGDGEDILIGGAGDDTAMGGGADDRLIGGQDNDVLLGQEGDDVAYGNGGDDTVDGGEGDDWVRGGQGQDSVAGGAGQDVVSGDRGDDTVSGGEGADIFLFFEGGGLDRVTDFSRAQGDTLVIEGHATFQVTQEGADTVVSVTATDRVVLVNVQVTSLTEGWIVS